MSTRVIRKRCKKEQTSFIAVLFFLKMVNANCGAKSGISTLSGPVWYPRLKPKITRRRKENETFA
jgi:hypothetical protein